MDACCALLFVVVNVSANSNVSVLLQLLVEAVLFLSHNVKHECLWIFYGFRRK